MPLDVDRVADTLMAGVERILDARLKPLRERIAELEGRAAKSLVYRGTWQRADEYRRGEAVTHAGQLWSAKRDTTAAPGHSTDWQLMTKAAR